MRREETRYGKTGGWDELRGRENKLRQDEEMRIGGEGKNEMTINEIRIGEENRQNMGR